MTNSSNSSNKKIPIIAQKKIGKIQPDEEVSIEKYAARVLVAMGKARFKNPEDDFRRPAATSESEKPSRRQYRRRDMTAQQ